MVIALLLTFPYTKETTKKKKEKEKGKGKDELVS